MSEPFRWANIPFYFEDIRWMHLLDLLFLFERSLKMSQTQSTFWHKPSAGPLINLFSVFIFEERSALVKVK